MLVLDICKEHIAASADGEGDNPADDETNEGELALVLPDYQIGRWRLGEDVLFVVDLVVFLETAIFLHLVDSLFHSDGI